MISRRGFIGGLLAAPAIVRASSLMSVVPVPATIGHRLTSEEIRDYLDRVVLPLAQRRMDALNQLRIIGWKRYSIINGEFVRRIETADCGAFA